MNFYNYLREHGYKFIGEDEFIPEDDRSRGRVYIFDHGKSYKRDKIKGSLRDYLLGIFKKSKN
jgi:hypothetical protein